MTLRATGTSFGIVDLTRGEMGSRGTSEEGDKEAQDAASRMGARFRENLDLPDCGIIRISSNLDLIRQTGVHFATRKNARTKFPRNIRSARVKTALEGETA
jgi:LmbE family N-acetylglucosaminyl deacetylase